MPPEWMIVLDLAKLQWFTFSKSTFLLKNRFIPRARGRARTRAARYFLKAIVAILELEASDASIRSERYLLYPFCERFVDCVLGLHRRDSYQDSTPLSHSSESKMQAPNSLRNCLPTQVGSFKLRKTRTFLDTNLKVVYPRIHLCRAKNNPGPAHA